jgi:gas vesicle protein
MLEFLAGLVLGGAIGMSVVALCVAAARGDQPRGDHHWHVGDDDASAFHVTDRRSK